MRDDVAVDIAEALAMRHALSITIESGFTNVILETDNIKLYNHLRKGIFVPSKFGCTLNDIHYLASLCHSCNYSFVKREGNHVAHGLAY